MSISEIFFWPVFASPVIAAAIAVIPYAIYFYWQRKRKADAAISLIYQ